MKMRNQYGEDRLLGADHLDHLRVGHQNVAGHQGHLAEDHQNVEGHLDHLVEDHLVGRRKDHHLEDLVGAGHQNAADHQRVEDRLGHLRAGHQNAADHLPGDLAVADHQRVEDHQEDLNAGHLADLNVDLRNEIEGIIPSTKFH
tara:strand:- start:286 stop:717 length:432 start_codon:yes stop_codon:yes gene_type:complete